MRSNIKPPIINWLIIKFYKYEKKIIITKLWGLKIKALLVYEKTSPYLLLNSKQIDKNLENFFFSFNKSFFQNFSFSMLMHVSDKPFISKKIFFFFKQNILDYSWFFFWRDISLNRLKYFFSSQTSTKRAGIHFIFLKDFIMNIKISLFNWNFVKIKNINNLFFFEPYFYFLLLSHHLENKNIIKKSLWKILYFGVEIEKLIFEGKFNEIFNFYNWFLTLQTGFLKNTSYFINWNYLFATSTQFPRARKIFLFNFFLKIIDLTSSKNFDLIFDLKSIQNTKQWMVSIRGNGQLLFFHFL